VGSEHDSNMSAVGEMNAMVEEVINPCHGRQFPSSGIPCATATTVEGKTSLRASNIVRRMKIKS